MQQNRGFKAAIIMQKIATRAKGLSVPVARF